MPRCPNGSRINKKTGLCESKTKKTTPKQNNTTNHNCDQERQISPNPTQMSKMVHYVQEKQKHGNTSVDRICHIYWWQQQQCGIRSPPRGCAALAVGRWRRPLGWCSSSSSLGHWAARRRSRCLRWARHCGAYMHSGVRSLHVRGG